MISSSSNSEFDFQILCNVTVGMVSSIFLSLGQHFIRLSYISQAFVTFTEGYRFRKLGAAKKNQSWQRNVFCGILTFTDVFVRF